MFPAVQTTPLGTPVVPDVKMIYAGSLGPTGTGGSELGGAFGSSCDGTQLFSKKTGTVHGPALASAWSEVPA